MKTATTPALAWILLVLLCPIDAGPTGAAQPPGPKATLHRDQVYATVDGQSLVADVYLPDDRKSPPLVVWIHGGGWRGGSHRNPRIGFVTQHGFALASVSYRFTPEAIFPAQIHDCKAAIRWLRANQNRFGYDASRIAVAGSSAGGHLALLLGTSGGIVELEGDVGDDPQSSSSVQAVVDYFGPADFILRDRTQPGRANSPEGGSFALLGGLRTGSVDRQLALQASPTRYVTPDDPPLMIVHGRGDKTVLVDQAERMANAYREAGLDVVLQIDPTAGHGSRSLFAGSYREAVLEFLRNHLAVP
jgi:acetyl esterase/lipase